jgi:hypothetical protein
MFMEQTGHGYSSSRAIIIHGRFVSPLVQLHSVLPHKYGLFEWWSSALRMALHPTATSLLRAATTTTVLNCDERYEVLHQPIPLIMPVQ